ncbi:glycosyltransferase family 4 protein [Nonomuraea sp. SYSU D8015]|uniref:glycosyltransferase family 4 protein n=1 Tax=Nonomuraea sp. SYSU D8015 TaxID=2593644 RepID=UPI001660A58B|nr:glycosyltransferase family 4 protein [Nonomuraea sp. SYSU D8015]
MSVIVVGTTPMADDDPQLQVAHGLADRLGGSYHFIVPCGAAKPGELDLHPVHIHRVKGRTRLAYVFAARRIVDRIAVEQRRLLMSSNPLAAIIIEITRARRRSPHIFHIQGEIVSPGPEYGGRLKRFALGAVTRLATRRASGVRVVSESLRSAVEPSARCPVAVVGSRVDTEVFRPPRSDGHAGDRKVDAVMVGGLAEVKNHRTMLQAWSLIMKQLPDARLLIVGDGPARRRLEAQIAALDLHYNVELRGFVPHDRLTDILTSAKCFVQASWSEGQPRAVLEGMACALPVICSDIPAHREIVPPDAGLLVPPGDVDGWAAAILTTLRDPTGAAELGRRGRALVIERHGVESSLDRYAEFIAAVAARNPRMATR